MNEQTLYNPAQDELFTRPFVDLDEWRDSPVRHRYIHGGFEGNDTKYSFYFPTPEAYQKRFFYFLSPVQGSEDAAQAYHGEEDKISFAVSHGAAFVESNMGGFSPDPTLVYRSSAAVAQHFRKVAADLFGEHRPYGYLYGGSGGSYKTISCMENTADVWDGAVPFVIPTPMSMPYPFTVRAHAMRILRDKFPQIVDAIAVGGSGDMYAGLNDEERDALAEVTKMGFPPEVWFAYDKIGDGALPVLAPYIGQLDPTYYEDFWTKSGYLGADPNSSVHRDRLRHKATVFEVIKPVITDKNTSGQTGVDEAWQTLNSQGGIQLRLDSAPTGALYLGSAILVFETGAAAGQRLPIASITGDKITLGSPITSQVLEQVTQGDVVLLDNSDYLAVQTYHRHQVPSPEFSAWNQFRNADGTPIYPQRNVIVGPILAYGGCGSVQTGRFQGKMIVVDSLLDESAFPWFASWYHDKVMENLGKKTDDSFRLWYIDKAMHHDGEVTIDPLQVVSYLGALQQALLDLSDWVERGIAPPASTSFRVEDCQVHVPDDAAERRGIQPTIQLTANGGARAELRVGESVTFSATVEVPPQAGTLVSATWDFEGVSETAPLSGERATLTTTHVYQKYGTYFPTLRVVSSRDGQAKVFTQVRNLASVRVVVS